MSVVEAEDLLLDAYRDYAAAVLGPGATDEAIERAAEDAYWRRPCSSRSIADLTLVPAHAVRHRPRRRGRAGRPSRGVAAGLRVAPGRTGPGEADADRGPGKAPASPPRRRAPRVARGTRGGARAQPRGTDGMTAVVMLLGGGRQRARPRGRRSREDDLARPWWSTAVPPTSRADAPAPAATPAFGGVGRTDGPPHPSLWSRSPSVPNTRRGRVESGQRSNTHVVPGTPTASHSSSGRPPGCRSTGCTSPGPLGPPTSCGTLRSSCTQPANPHRASPLVVRKRRSRPVGPGADPPAAEWIARIAACRCDRCLRFCARGAVGRSWAGSPASGAESTRR